MANHVVSFLIRAKDGATTVFRAITNGAKSMIAGLLRNGANIQAWGQMIAGVVHKVGEAFQHLWSAIRESMKFETLTGQFKVLLGSMDAARERMASLAKFAEVTPFQLDEIARASRMLTVMSQDALGTEWALKLVGDTAAATGGSIEELSTWIGRAYAMIAAGKPFGEAAMRLTELGALTPEVRDKMEALQAAGASSAAVWGVLTDHLEGFGGAMEELSQTGDGLVSTLSDNWTAAIRTFGDAFLEETKSGIVFMINKLKELKESGAIEKWANAAVEALKPVKDLMVAVFGSDGTRGEALSAAWDYLKSIFLFGGDVIKAAANYMADIMRIPLLELRNLMVKNRNLEEDKRLVREHSAFGFEMAMKMASAKLGEATDAAGKRIAKAADASAAAAAKVSEASASDANTNGKERDGGKKKSFDHLNQSVAPSTEVDAEEARRQAQQEIDAIDFEEARRRSDEDALRALQEAAKAEESAGKARAEAAKAEAKAAKKAAENAKARLEELEKRAKDSDYERDQRKKEEKEAKKREKDERRLRRRANRLLKQFATLRDPNALLRGDFDEKRLGHSQRAVRDWMLAQIANRNAQADAAAADRKVDETNSLLKEIRDQNKELLSLS